MCAIHRNARYFITVDLLIQRIQRRFCQGTGDGPRIQRAALRVFNFDIDGGSAV